MRVRIECAEYSNRGVKKACSVNAEEEAAEGATSGKASPRKCYLGSVLTVRIRATGKVPSSST